MKLKFGKIMQNKDQDITSAGQACRIPGLNFQSEFPVYAENLSCAILVL